MTVKHPVRRAGIKVIAFLALSALLTTVVVESLLDVDTSSTHAYTAQFSDASGLQGGDTVRIAGVEVGKVSGVSIRDHHVQVAFTLDSSQRLTTTSRAEIHFENLLGQRFLALLPGSTPGRPLPPGGDIPMSRTAPALDLNAVFNGFEPLFNALAPDQVNRLAESIIQVFQGESGTVGDLVAQTASITNNLADRQQVIDGVLTNLAGLLNAVGAHSDQLGQLVSSFDSLAKAVASSRTQLGETVDSFGSLASQVGALLHHTQPTLHQDIAGLGGATRNLAAVQGQLTGVLNGLPGLLDTVTKIQSTGNYLNIYICNLTVNVKGSLDISLIPGVPAPQYPDPVHLPSGPIGDQSEHTAACA